MPFYGQSLIHERHRHRYEVNNDYRDALVDAGMLISGTSPDIESLRWLSLRITLGMSLPVPS
jgi:CTP synthase